MEKINKLKRITQNTLMLFVRILILTIVNLYAVRLLLRGLGACDYGIYNAVAGVVTLSSCLIPVFSQAIQRFYSYLSGKGETEKQQTVFSVSTNVVICFCIILFLIFETAGIWMLNSQMMIPENRLYSANIAFQFAMFSFFFTLLQIPYIAAIYAHEEMGIYALVSCLDCVLKLLAAFLIGITAIDNLVFYSISLSIIAIIVFTTYMAYAKKHYTECRYTFIKSKSKYKKLLSFTGWSMLGSMAGVGLIQGSAILLNIFFGPLVNAAFAIAISIYNATLSLANSIVLAFRAPMIKAYAANEMKILDVMFGISNKCILYLLSAITIPFFVEMEQVLTIWLGSPSVEVITFARIILIYTVCLAISSPITTIIQATGNVKFYYICTDSMTLMHLPLAYIMLRLGMPSYSVLLSMLSVIIIAHIIRIVILKRCLKSFKLRTYLQEFLLRGLVITIISYLTTRIFRTYIDKEIIRLLTVFMVSPMITIILFAMFGTNSSERHQLFKIAINLIKRK